MKADRTQNSTIHSAYGNTVGWSKSFEPDYLLLDFWAKKCYWPYQRSLWKNLVVCLFTLQDIWFDIMTDFNKIRYHAVISNTGERSVATDTQSNDCCIRWMCTVICHSQALGSRVSSRQKQPWRWAPVRTSTWSCLWRKTVMLLKILYCKIVEWMCSW